MIVLSDFSAKVGRGEETFKTNNLHETSDDNGVRVVNFATSKNLHVKSTMFPHCKICNYAWTPTDGKTHNQIDVSIGKDGIQVSYGEI
jgi:hypothetical protein